MWWVLVLDHIGYVSGIIFIRGIGGISVRRISSKSLLEVDSARLMFGDLWSSLTYLSGSELDIGCLERAYRLACFEPYMVRHFFQLSAGFDWGVGSGGDVRVSYVYRCLGHCVPDRVFFSYPRMCVLVALVFFGGRWRVVEDVVAGDDAACLFYSRLVLGGRRLPWRMHQQVVLRSFVGVSEAMGLYLGQFTAQKKRL